MVETHAGRRAGWLGVDQFVGGGTTVRGALSARRHLAVVTSRAIDHCSRRRRVRTIRPPASIRQDDDRTLAPGAVVALGV